MTVGQNVKKAVSATEGPLPALVNDLNAAKRVGEIRRTSDSDIGRAVAEKSASVLGTRHPEPNGVRKDLVNQEKRRRLSLVDEKDLRLSGKNQSI